ncbi:hypothetical protein, partial [Bacillus velezensis]|uniref:hypothetical protein n=1 Tax=Bacillus velezensis TaxID=492670 RepID=UPI0015D6657B
PGQYLDFKGAGGVALGTPTSSGAKATSTWCAQEAEYGTGFAFTLWHNSWRAIRGHGNGLVYGAADWDAALPGDGLAHYVENTAWTIGEPWAAPSLSAGQVLEIESAGQAGACLSTRDRSTAEGPVIAAVGCSEVWQMRRWELVETGADAFALRNYIRRDLCLSSADDAG